MKNLFEQFDEIKFQYRQEMAGSNAHREIISLHFKDLHPRFQNKIKKKQ